MKSFIFIDYTFISSRTLKRQQSLWFFANFSKQKKDSANTRKVIYLANGRLFCNSLAECCQFVLCLSVLTCIFMLSPRLLPGGNLKSASVKHERIPLHSPPSLVPSTGHLNILFHSKYSFGLMKSQGIQFQSG